jgi:hypothetical protein
VKIQLNLVRPANRLERSSTVWAPALIIASLALLVLILWSAWGGFVEFRKVHRSVLTYQAEIADLQKKQIHASQVLHQTRTLAVYHQINFLNSLIERKKLSLSDLALRVIKLLPTQTRLQSLALAETDEAPIVQFSVEGEQDGVYAFLGNLEESPDFEAPAKVSEAIEQEGTNKGLVLLTCTARYVGAGPAIAERKLR